MAELDYEKIKRLRIGYMFTIPAQLADALTKGVIPSEVFRANGAELPPGSTIRTAYGSETTRKKEWEILSPRGNYRLFEYPDGIYVCDKGRYRSQAQLATDAGVQRQTICRIEAGNSNITCTTLALLAHGLGVPITELFAKGANNETAQ